MKSLRIVCLVVACGLAVAAAGGRLLLSAPFKASDKRNPFDGSGEAARAGAKLYAKNCASCHGLNREGHRKFPRLDQPEVYAATPGTLFWVLRHGSLRRGMPSFAHLPEAQRWQLVTFLRSEANQ